MSSIESKSRLAKLLAVRNIPTEDDWILFTPIEKKEFVRVLMNATMQNMNLLNRDVIDRVSITRKECVVCEKKTGIRLKETEGYYAYFCVMHYPTEVKEQVKRKTMEDIFG